MDATRNRKGLNALQSIQTTLTRTTTNRGAPVFYHKCSAPHKSKGALKWTFTKEITERITAQMEEGVAPWCKPWVSGKAVSHVTGKPCSLLNQMLLGKPGEYLSFKQCQQEGGKVKTGEILAVFFRHYPTYAAGKMNISELARVCGLSRPTVYKYLKILG